MVGRHVKKPYKSGMKNVWESINEIGDLLKSAEGVQLFLDFDGTLSPIVPDFKGARIEPDIKNVLKKITLLKNVFVMIVSGRKLESLKEKINLPGLNYAGNHGLEWTINGIDDRHPLDKKVIMSLNDVKSIFSNLSQKHKGLFVEDKSMSISLHYRNLEVIDEEAFKKDFFQSVEKIKKDNIIEFVEGKKVIDARPRIKWDKGRIVGMVTEMNPGKLTIAIGDDTTDEDMFGKIVDGITIRVGESDHSKARYCLNTVEDVQRFLEYVYKELAKKNHSQKLDMI